jgi:glycosyltransferase involved in cell wall biosynthesis
MPVLNGERFIEAALTSIVAQTYKNLELIIVDDGSTDGTLERIERFRDKLAIRYLRHDTPLGIAVSVNDGIRAATGEYVAFLDHDDAWLPEFLETQTRYLDEHPDVGMVHSDFQTIDAEGTILEDSVATCRRRERPSGHVFPQLFMDSFIVGNSVLIRRECFNQLGIFDETLKWADYHMWLRVARKYKVDYVGKVLTAYRQHSTQQTRTDSSQPPDEAPVAVKAIRKLVEEHPEIRKELGDRTIRRRMASFYFDLAYGWFLKDELGNARLCIRHALRLWPTNPSYLTLYAATLLRPSQARAAREALRRLRGGAELAGGVRG